MLRLLNLLTFRSLGTHRLRTLLSIFGIVLGVANILAIGITNLAAMDSVTHISKTHLTNQSDGGQWRAG